MKRHIAAVGLLFLVAGCAQARVTSGSDRPARFQHAVPSDNELELRDPATSWLRVGEELEYGISWWGVPVSTVKLSVLPAGQRGKVALVCRARSNPYLESFYQVRLRLVSVFDVAARAPDAFEAYVRRRARKHQSTITFDRSKWTAFHRLPKGKSAEVPVRPDTQDGLSLLYYARSLPFRVGKTIPLQVSADGKNWDINGRIKAANIVKVRKVGEFGAYLGTIELAYPVPFFHGARAEVWFSDDEERIPLLAKIHSKIGPVSVALLKRTINPDPQPYNPESEEQIESPSDKGSGSN